MRTVNVTAGILLIGGAVLVAQTTQPSSSGTAAQTAPTGIADTGAGTQTWSGTLFDANCPAISSDRNRRFSSLANDPGERQYRSGTQSAATGASTSTSTVGAAGTRDTSMNTQSPATRSAETSSTQPTSGSAATGARSRAGTDTTSSAASGQSEASRPTASAPTGTASTSGTAGTTSTAGTTGTTSTTATTGTGTAGVGRSSTDAGMTSSTTADSSRSRTGASTSVAGSASPDYSACRVTPATTAFALHSNGRLIMLDQAGNDRVRQQLQSSWFTNPSNTNRDVNASVAGSMQGDALTVSTVTIP